MLKFLLALTLMSGCVVIHAVGVTSALRRIGEITAERRPFVLMMWTCTRLAVWMIVCHIAEIVLWAAAYVWLSAMPDMVSAFYFSMVTYTTTGYGDLVLPQQWRLLGGIEALTGILMCGWSTAIFFAELSAMTKASAAIRPRQ